MSKVTALLFPVAMLAFAADAWLDSMKMGNQLRVSGDLAAAESQYLTALELAGSDGVNHARYGQTLNNLAGVYQDRGDYNEAESMLLRAVTILEKRLGPVHRELALSLNNLGVLYGQMGRFPDAEAAHLRAIRISEQLGQPGQDQLAVALAEVGGLYLQAGRLEDSETSLGRALPLTHGALGANHRTTTRILLYLGNIAYAKGEYERAEARWIRALSTIDSSGVLQDHLTAATLRMNLGELKRYERRYAESESLLCSAIAVFETNASGSHPLLPTALNHLALTYAEQGRTAEAERVYNRASAMLESSKGNSPVGRRQHAVLLLNLARFREQHSTPVEAAALFRRALESAELAFGPAHASLKAFLYEYSRILRRLGRRREARDLEQRTAHISAADTARQTVDVRDLSRMSMDAAQR